MSHTTTDEEAAGRAALYALGALEGDEAREFEGHLAEGCQTCAAELRLFEGVVADLGLAAPEAEPPAGVRSRLLALVSEGGGGAAGGAADDDCAETTHADAPADGANLRGVEAEGFLVVRAGEGDWLPTDDAGVAYKMLFADPGRGTVTTLVRMRPGSRIRSHRHLGVEQCLVLEGDVSSGPHTLSAGDFNCALAGSVHDELTSVHGALLLIVSPESYDVLSPRA